MGLFDMIKRWLFGKDSNSEEQKKAQSVKRVKDFITRQEQLSKKHQSDMLTYKEKAKQFMKQGNKAAAKQALRQSKIAEARYVRALNTKENLSARLTALEDAVDQKETAAIFRDIQNIIAGELQGMDAGTIDELQGEFEEQLDIINMTNESLSDTSGISAIDDYALEEELNIMATEAELSRTGPLPGVSTEPIDSDAITTPEEGSEEKDDLDKELEGLLDSVND